MTRVTGRRLPIAPPRRVVVEMLQWAKRIPTVPVQRTMNIASLVSARSAAPSPPGWPAIFLRAFALTAQRQPALRRIYVDSWRPYLYEGDSNVAMIAIERMWQNEPHVFMARINAPETVSARELDRRIQEFKTAPIDSISSFRRMVLLGRFPGPLRRLVLRLRMSGSRRYDRCGNLGLSVYSSLGAESLHPIAPTTALLHYGVIRPSGLVDVRITYDHRVTDGAVIARALAEMETILVSQLTNELNAPCSRAVRAA